MNIKVEVYTRGEEIRLRRKILDTLRRSGIKNIKEHVWPKKINAKDIYSLMELEKYREFKEWANKNEINLDPFFKERIKESKDKKYKEITLPVASIATYLDNEIKCVFPCRYKKTDFTISDFIDPLKNKTENKKL